MKALIFALALAAPMAHAQPHSTLFTGQDLYTRFSTDRATALAYIAGVADSQAGITLCIPPHRVTLGQLGDMVRQALERTPSERHMSADIYVQVALETRWPCAKRGGGV